jgi:hypothetical protein
MRDYFLTGGGLAYYNLHSEKDGLERVRKAGMLIQRSNFVFPKPDVRAIIIFGNKTSLTF